MEKIKRGRFGKLAKDMTQMGLWRGVLSRLGRRQEVTTVRIQNDRIGDLPVGKTTAVADGLVALLADRDHAAAAAAEAALRGAVMAQAPTAGGVEMLAVAVDRYVDHRRIGVAELLVRFRASVAWHGVQDNPLVPVLRDPGHPVHLVIRGLIRRGSLGEDAALLWRVMSEPVWAGACREHLSQRLTRSEKASLCAAVHLELNPHRAKLADARNPTAALAAAVERGDVGALAQLAGSGDNRIAVAAARGLVFSHAGDAAARTLREDLLKSLVESKHSSVREVVTRAITDADRAMTRRRARIGRDATIHELRAAMASDVPMMVMRTVEEVRRLRMANEVVPELCRIVMGSENRAAAAACAALRRVPNDRVFDALRRAIEAEDHRVAATALESLVAVAIQIGQFSEIATLLEAAICDDRHRVRAAAARALAQGGNARGEEVVRAMLEDSRAGHRLAGLWAADRLLRAGLIGPGPELAVCLRALAAADRSSAIRRRAEMCRDLIRCLVSDAGVRGCAARPVGV